ncbi:protein CHLORORESPIRATORY REDUCTION 7, chloroplastic [Selaginella moellendorffii]|nr:protein CHLORORESPIRATORY REDUCTION 7, chloroplastic [Selaginella moellendorffii]|eukprot:XP_002993242.2 protein CHLORORESPIRATORY REDUCTION 7, chloroplastic [Selaginella moellendorffii]
MAMASTITALASSFAKCGGSARFLDDYNFNCGGNSLRFRSISGHCQRISKSLVVNRNRAGGQRGIMYEDEDTFVLLEPGEDEVFVSMEQLQSRIKSWLERWPSGSLPFDLQNFKTLDEAASHLVSNSCELEIGGGFGSIQWFQVRLEER